MGFKWTRKLDSNGDYFFFQKLRSKKILINSDSQNIGSLCDAKDNLFLLLICGFTEWVIPPNIKQTVEFQIQLNIIWLWGIKPDLCSLAPDSTDYFHSDVFQHPGFLVIAAKMHHLVLPNLLARCTYLFARTAAGPVSAKHGQRMAGVEVRSTRAALLGAWDGQKAGWEGYSVAITGMFLWKREDVSGWSLESGTNSWEKQ